MPGPKTCQAAAGKKTRSPASIASNGLTPTAHRTIQITRAKAVATRVVIPRARLQGECGGELRDHFADPVCPALGGGPNHTTAHDYAVRELANGRCLIARRDAESD